MFPATERQLLARTARAQRDGRLPSLVAGVVRDGALAWHSARGEGAGPDVQYRLGSITKTVTAVLVLRLRDEGRVRLDDAVETHVPGTPLGDRTVGQLLAHLGGVAAEAPGEWWERTPGVDWPGLSARLGPADVVLPAGRRFHYSNLGYGVLGELVARLRGRPWYDAARDEVFAPLGMTRTTARPEPPAAQGYAVHPWADVVLVEPEHDAGAMAPAGQLWSTVTDLGRWAAFLLGDGSGVLDPATLEEMAVPGGADPTAPDWAAYGLGLQLVRVDGHLLAGHGGSMPGFLAGVFVDRAAGIGACAMANATSGLDGALLADLIDVVRRTEPAVPDAWRPATAVDPDAMALTGHWWWGTVGFGMQLRADGMLELAPTGMGTRASRFRRTPDGGWTGLDAYYAGEALVPVRDATGAVVAFRLATMVFTRTPYDPAAPVPGGLDSGGWRTFGAGKHS